MNPSNPKNNQICSSAMVGSTCWNSGKTLSVTSLMEIKEMQMMQEHARRCRGCGSSLHSTASPIFSMPTNSAFVTVRHRNQLSARAVCRAARLTRTEPLSWCVQTLMGAKVSLPFSSAELVGQGVSEGGRKKFWILSTIMGRRVGWTQWYSPDVSIDSMHVLAVLLAGRYCCLLITLRHTELLTIYQH